MIDFHDYCLPKTSRIRENIEWSITYKYNANDHENPRVLLIGDSICNGYQNLVREELGSKVNITFLATSKCVTDPEYMRELDFITDGGPFAMITFNNGLHSLTTDRAEWQQAYRNTVRFLRDKFPNVILAIVNSTPMRDQDAAVHELNDFCEKLAAEQKLPLLDLFGPMSDLDPQTRWTDGCHFADYAKQVQRKVIGAFIMAQLKIAESAGKIEQKSNVLGPSGTLR